MKNLNAARWIKQIIGKDAKKLGLIYEGSHKDGYVLGYTFLHKEEEYEECIDFTIIGNMIRMMFLGSGERTQHIEASHLIKSNFPSEGSFIYFEDEENFKEILMHFANIIREKGEESFAGIKGCTAKSFPGKAPVKKFF